MITNKTELRIEQFIEYLKKRRFSNVETDSEWIYAETTETYGDKSPSLDMLQWDKISSFPFQYGKEWINYWFFSSFNFKKEREAEYYISIETETDSLIYIDGKIEAASNPCHPFLKLNQSKFTIMIESWGGHFFPGFHPDEEGRVMTTLASVKKRYPLFFKEPRILKKNKEIWDLYYDAYTLYSLSKSLDKNTIRFQRIVSKLHDSLIKLDFTLSDKELCESAKMIREEIQPLLKAKNGTSAPIIYSIGAAHIDHAWLWPISETTRKAARTALNMVKYLNEYPDFKYISSQPAQMVEVKQKYPSVYQRVLEAYKEGRWEAVGTSWIEPDCMLSSGESLIRQFLVGLKYSRELYPNYSSDVFWIPDSFGYNGQLPQILKGCKMNYFVTSKIGWNETNVFPYGIFEWEGIDGTRIKSHMIMGAYNGSNDPKEIQANWNKIQHKDMQSMLIRSIGEGDGGGGTTIDDIELIKREEDLEGLPKNSWKNLEDALVTIFSSPLNKPLPVYKGELYLELHRGAYTSQSNIKKYNKTLEVKIHNAEYLLALTFSEEGMSKRVKKAKELIDKAWLILLTNQFHDILPGSIIRKASEEANKKYSEAKNYLEEAIVLLQDIDKDSVLFSFTPSFFISYKDIKEVILVEKNKVTTSWATIQIDEYGFISSLVVNYGGVKREIVEKGRSLNTLTLSPDYTLNWDAWDMEYDTLPLRRSIGKPLSIKIVNEGNIAFVECEYDISNLSKIRQKTIIHNDSHRIDFETMVIWKEKHKVLRAEFPTVIRAVESESSIPFGYIKRSTMENNSWQRAQFEFPVHLWLRLGDATTSCIMASPHKYGYSVKDNEMSITLLRSPEAPDPLCDVGEHEFSYSFFVEEGGEEGLRKAIADGYSVSNPPINLRKVNHFPFEIIYLSGLVILETVKLSEKEDGFVLRFYEALGGYGAISIQTPSDMSVSISNMIEEDEIKTSEDKFNFEPFEVKTFIIRKNK